MFVGFTCCPPYYPVSVKITNVSAWLNLMPGSEPKFYLNGNAAYIGMLSFDEVTSMIEYVAVLQNEKIIDRFKPAIIIISKDLKGNDVYVCNFEFTTGDGLKINSKLYTDDSIDVAIQFRDDTELPDVIERGIKVEKAY